MDKFEDNESRQAMLRDGIRDNPIAGRSFGPGSGVAFLIGAILVVFAIVAYGMWSGNTNTGPGGTSTTTIEQPANQPPATNSPG